MNNSYEYCTQGQGIHFKYRKGISPVKGKEFHDYHEFVLFRGGKSRLISTKIQQELTPGSIIVIPKAHFHQFCIENPHDYTRCILGFYENPEISGLIHDVMTEVKVINSPDQRLVYLFERLTEAADSNLSQEEKIMFTRASLVQILIYLKQYDINAVSKNITISPVVQQALIYIDKCYTENISVESIAKALYISSSTLAHKFSKELNISVYRYICQKRLSSAREYIENGDSLTAAAEKSGFSDYSCFYRMYKKRYLSNPGKSL